MRLKPLQIILAACMAILLLACVHSSPPSRFYTLHAGGQPGETGSVAIGDGWVGIGPVGLPSYLDRPQIVTRGDGHRLVIHEFDRWGDPLKGRVLQVLMDNVVALSQSKKVAPYPWPTALEPDRRVIGEVSEFEAGPDGEVVLRVRWVVQSPGKPEEAAVHLGEYREPAAPGDFDAMVAAMSRALGRWSGDIAVALAAWKPPASN